ncbi:1-acylglycerol-3-phosphate O-acyltransferase ABHD5-like [Schistocerca piceifrons]|uniref:1-acylglycerol-3-phosphate O-acyltransferase ABHD5-like n=1 Tax=Schistocerca piceifrons TaxID=274613 RepID=UPI001F5F387C|nr:1-acylglycerol-3-phosphate O-acyltransferase ABHD5-like [Schistocerca piceifrons]XP_047117152.1 1-acylglycerol-3-phosphate O-acyltransferase ABHD5-like [Schistocerca piceifrons]XP_047117153.1 1-acylglycerol-3-phosphate O-acyltransferase ABHD5-like [Schistocerca piceifrons]XP_047117154.1 1-acylglycerol-3-phosphate O-acyltransferase ABHD5-like [Schistocerca piceifrons]XP_047117155.1 1-acylglycerol-3-phosphate O-acyltransferase ABHD5-like [Schistocerca piceifrons]
MADNEIATVKSRYSWPWEWLQWCPASADMLRTIERKILSYLKTTYRGWYVDIGPVVGSSDKIWTISLNEDSPRTPIVLLHGLAAGVALWCLNLDALARTRPVYAIDLLGFGRSSRPNFSSDALEAEQQFVRSVEEWRREMKLEKMILLGHSMGGYLAASYSLTYPNRVKHLILADPWGFPEKPPEASSRTLPLWVRAIGYMLQPFNPLWPVRLAGPFGQWLIEKARPDITRKFETALSDDVKLIPQYIYQCNAQYPTGEAAFHSMMFGFGWAKNPMIKRIHLLPPEIPITVIYGSRSWIQNNTGEAIRNACPNSYVSVQVVTGAGHHVYADKSDLFNRHVVEACEISDLKEKTIFALRAQNDKQENEEEENKNKEKLGENPSTPHSTTNDPL